VAGRVLDNMTQGNLKFSAQGAKAITTADFQMAKEILTAYGEYIVKDKAQDVATELAHVLAGRKTFNYEELRRDPKVRAIAIQTLFTPHGPAGYTDLYDRHGYILFHPDRNVEGHNQLNWEKQYPETTALVKRSFKEDNVSGYFNLLR